MCRVAGAAVEQPSRVGQADQAGEALRKDVLNRLIRLDPEPEELEAALLAVVAELGEPTGPTRAVGLTIQQEWEMVVSNPSYWSFLVREALQGDEKRQPRRFRFPDQAAASE